LLVFLARSDLAFRQGIGRQRVNSPINVEVRFHHTL